MVEDNLMNAEHPENLIFACSGAADVGGIADQAARRLAQSSDAAFCCTAAIAAKVPPILQRAAWAARIVAIDGCDKACARKILEDAGAHKCAHIELGALGLEKGKSPATEENITRVINAAQDALK